MEPVIIDTAPDGRLVYACDPAKNDECRKTSCFLYGGPCHGTFDPEHARMKRPTEADLTSTMNDEQLASFVSQIAATAYDAGRNNRPLALNSTIEAALDFLRQRARPRE